MLAIDPTAAELAIKYRRVDDMLTRQHKGIKPNCKIV